MRYKNIYVAATNQHVGKTTSTLGLVSCMLQKGINVGYCKPVGQKFLDLKNLYVDKDTLLFADLIKFDINPEYHSPIILPSSTVRDYIDHPTHEDFLGRITQAKDFLNHHHDLTIFEGTGHPGVGSVVGLSNASVAKSLNASVILIVEGGIGSTIDMFHMCSAVFREQNIPISGVIVNKVRPDKLGKIEYYLKTYLDRLGIPLLGLVPYDECLAYPLMSTVADSIKGNVELNAENLDNNRVENILAGSSVDLKELNDYQNNLVVASTRTIDRAISRIQTFSDSNNILTTPISGVIVTGEGDINPITKDYVMEHHIPLIRTNFDTFGVVIKISKIEVKINRHTPWKIQRAIELINENIDLDKILQPL